MFIFEIIITKRATDFREIYSTKNQRPNFMPAFLKTKLLNQFASKLLNFRFKFTKIKFLNLNIYLFIS